MLSAGIYILTMDSRLKTSGMTTIRVIIYWDWYYILSNQTSFLFETASAIFFNCLSMLTTGFQPSKLRALELSNCKEPNRRLATSPLPTNLATKLIQLAGTEINHACLPKAFATFRNSSVVETDLVKLFSTTQLRGFL